MTKREAEILNFLKQSSYVNENEIANRFKDSSCGVHSVIRTCERLEYLVKIGYVTSTRDTHLCNITSIGLHALDEYLENVTRLDRVEASAEESNSIARGSSKSARWANVIAVVAAVISILSLIASLTVEVCRCL